MELNSIIEAMKDPQMRHAALVHLPIALSILALFPALASALVGAKNTTLRWIAMLAFALLIGAAVLGVRSGEAAEEEVGQLPAAVHETLEEHEEMAEKVWIFALASTVLAGFALVPGKNIRIPSAWLAVAAGFATAGWVGVTAHHGGSLVYESGVGTPGGVQVAASATDDEDAGEGEADADAPLLIASTDPRAVFFRNEVHPILDANCIGCHKPGGRRLPGDLDQTTIAGLLTGGNSGPAIVPGDPDNSLLIQVVRWEIEDLKMPPQRDAEQLPPEQIAVLEQWVRDGAVWVDVATP